MQPSDSLAPIGRGSGSPCLRPTPMRALVLGPPRVRPQTRGTSETDHRRSASPACFRGETRASRVTGPSSSCVPWSNTPPDTIPSSPIHGEIVVAFRHFGTLGIRNNRHFEAANPTAHTLACLRFAGLVAATVARLATGSGGLTPGRAGFAPAGRQTKFHGVIAPSIPLRPAGPGRNRNVTVGTVKKSIAASASR